VTNAAWQNFVSQHGINNSTFAIARPRKHEVKNITRDLLNFLYSHLEKFGHLELVNITEG
jgi:hypothetical protein